MLRKNESLSYLAALPLVSVAPVQRAPRAATPERLSSTKLSDKPEAGLQTETCNLTPRNGRGERGGYNLLNVRLMSLGNPFFLNCYCSRFQSESALTDAGGKKRRNLYKTSASRSRICLRSSRPSQSWKQPRSAVIRSEQVQFEKHARTESFQKVKITK